MIKLTLTPKTQPITYVFEKNCVTIGKISANEVPPDLALPYGGLETIHVKIEFNGSQFVAFNIAEDPFATINELPFSRKSIKSGDILHLAGMILHFEAYYEEEKIEIILPEIDDILVTMLEDKIHATYEDSVEIDETMDEELESNLSFFHENPPSTIIESKGASRDQQSSKVVKKVSNLSLAEEELDALLLQVEELEEQSSYLLHENLTTESPLPTPKASSSEQQDIPLDQEKVAEAKLEQPTKLEQPQEKLVTSETKLEQHIEIETKLEQPEIKLEQILPNESIELKEPDQTVPPQLRRSMKDDSTEEDTAKKSNHTSSQSVSFNAKSLVTGLAAFILLIGIVFGCFYFVVTGHNEEKEIKAAQAVADVAMALNYAQINHAKALNQNWSNPDFLKHNLAGVLPAPYSPLAKVDSHGHLLNTSYILRIYTGSDDLKHFLIIAQPNPGLLQWLVPKAAITVDSSFMELRKIDDLKTLNRLLVNATLDTSNSADIANFVRLGELVPLVELKKYHPHSGFDYPKGLADLYPGAENLIYNSARYYSLGETLMRKAIAIYENEDNTNDVPALVDEINRFTRFPNLVLYSSNGIQMAQRGQKALTTFFPQYKFLHAYLQFNSQNFATHSYLLIDGNNDGNKTSNEIIEEKTPSELEATDTKELAIGDQEYQISTSSLDDLNFINEFYLEEVNRLTFNLQNKEKTTPIKAVTMPLTDKEIDRYHPLYHKLKALAYSREKSLKLINDEIDREWGNSYKVTQLRETYNRILNDHQNKIIKGITALQKEYSSMPLTKFMTYVRAAGVKPFIQENLRRHLDDINHAPFPEESMNTSIEKIRRSTNLQELEKNLQETSKLLNLDNFPDPALFITYQKEIHSTVIHKINTLLHSPSIQSVFQPENRPLIAMILKNAWVTDQEEINEYLKEFDLLGAQ